MSDDSIRHRLEIAAAILLGLATVATAWAAYQSAVWSGVQDSSLAESIRLTSQATDANQFADSTRNFDQTIFVEILTTIADGGDIESEAVAVLSESFSAEGTEAFVEWVETDLDDPFQSPTYLDTLYGPGESLLSSAEDLVATANDANANSDDYVLMSTFFASVLFIAGVSSVIESGRTRLYLLIGAGLLFAVSAVWLLTLPPA